MSFALTGEEHKPDNFNGGDDDKDGCGLVALLLFVAPAAAALIVALAATASKGGKTVVTNDRDTGKVVAIRGGKIKEVGKGEAAALFTSKGHWEGGRWVVDEEQQWPY